MKTFIFVAGLIAFYLFFSFTSFAQYSRNIARLYSYHEKKCVDFGWRKVSVDVAGIERKILWNGPPEGYWPQGAIVVLHGGGGTYSNFCSNIRIGNPMEEFSALAFKEGFAVFSLDSLYNSSRGINGFSCGKRWDCLAKDGSRSSDLDFIEFVIKKIIPSVRPPGSSDKIFLTGISNGGYMTILAATHLNQDIAAFAPVSTGDPYGTYQDCTPDQTPRANAPGFFIDLETNSKIHKAGACYSTDYPNEKEWPEVHQAKKPDFKQFHHEKDGGVDISCMRKAQLMLTQHGYRDAGPYIIKDDGPDKLWKHLWLRAYNQPLLDFFKSYNE